jgi:hypothetical protein
VQTALFPSASAGKSVQAFDTIQKTSMAAVSDTGEQQGEIYNAVVMASKVDASHSNRHHHA